MGDAVILALLVLSAQGAVCVAVELATYHRRGMARVRRGR